MPMRILPTVLVLLCACTAVSAENDVAASWAALRAGGTVAVLRHTNADNGPATPPAVIRADDCSTQRNLTDRGRAEARQLGDQFRTERIPVAKVLTSDWCHAHQTATLLGLAAPEVASSFGAFMDQERIREMTEQARDLVAAWSGPGTLVVVTHQTNVLALLGIKPDEGEIVVIKPEPADSAKLRVLGRIPLQR